MPSVRHMGTAKGMLCWEGLGKWLEVRGSVYFRGIERSLGPENSPNTVTGAGSTLQSKSGGHPDTVQSITSCSFSLRDNRRDSPWQETSRISHLGHLVSYLPLDPIFKHLCLLLCAYVILVMQTWCKMFRPPRNA